MSCGLRSGTPSANKPRRWRSCCASAIFGCSMVVATLVVPLGVALAEDPPSFVLKWGSNGTGPGQFRDPFGIAVDPTGNVYVCDSNNDRIQKFDNDGNFLLQWGTRGTDPGQFRSPASIAVDDAGDVYVGDLSNNRVQKFDSFGNWIGAFAVTVATYHLDVDPAGTFVAIASTLRFIGTFTTTGTPIASWQPTNASDFSTLGGIAIGPDARIYVSVRGDSQIEQFSASGTSLEQWAITGPAAIDLDAAGNVYVESDNAIVKLTSDGEFVWQFGSGVGEFAGLADLAIDRDGNIFTVESSPARVQKFSNGPTPTLRKSWGAVKAAYR